jgi:peptidoglycan hydrolase CwlO-like protein
VPSPKTRTSHRLAAIALVLTLGFPAHAVALPGAADVADKRAQATQAQAEMQRMQSRLQAGMSDYVKVSGELEDTRNEIAKSNARMGVLQKRLKTVETRLGQRAEYMYRTSDAGALDVLFGASTFEEFLTRLDLLSRIAQQDAGLIVEAKAARTETEQLRAGLKKRESRLIVLRDRSAAQRDALESDLNRQRQYFTSLSADVAALLAAQERANRKVTVSTQCSPSSSGGAAGGGRKPRAGNGLAVATIEGRSGSYYVMADEPLRYRATGVGMDTEASVYSVADNGTGTASGRALDDSELTCAHKTLALGTRVAITHGGRRVICVVTDRGPYAPPGRDLDLTPRAASLLGIDGIADVHYEVVVPSS